MSSDRLTPNSTRNNGYCYGVALAGMTYAKLLTEADSFDSILTMFQRNYIRMSGEAEMILRDPDFIPIWVAGYNAGFHMMTQTKSDVHKLSGRSLDSVMPTASYLVSSDEQDLAEPEPRDQ
jgi:hypothetical protein